MAIFLAACASSPRDIQWTPGVLPIERGKPGYEETVQVQYLGVGGLLFRRGDDVIMTPPFYSNSGLIGPLFGVPIRPDTNRIEEFLPPVNDVDAILVGHAHYDHLMDVPYIANYHATNAVIFGSDTAKNIVAAEVAESRLYSVECDAGEFRQDGSAGEWLSLANTRVRIMALKSEHAPHVGPIKLFTGKVTRTLKTLPECAHAWEEGQTLAYIVDFLGHDEQVAFRIVYHDSAVNSPRFGGMPKLPQRDQRQPDLLVVAMASSGNVDNYPEGLVCQLKPKNVIVCHWEDFFDKEQQGHCVKMVPLVDAAAFMDRLSNAKPSTRPHILRRNDWLRFE